jgi:ATP/maltotriose-dependent transcriptional regulator MalT/DNA-binding SARP family transcriptional activator
MQDAGSATVPTSKVVPPALPEALLERPALDHRITEACRRQVTLVVAPAGFAKTTSVAAALDPVRRVAWYRLDPGDRTLSRLVRGLVDALRLRVPELGADALVGPSTGLGPDAGSNERTRALATAAALAEALAATGRDDVVLVLDDLHEIEGAEGALALVEALCRSGPCHLVLASRTAVPFPLDRLRGQGQLAEIGPHELAFTPHEVTAVLASLGADAPAEAAEVARLTGGWPAGVRLAGEALLAAPAAGRGDVLARLGRQRGALQRYLLHEVLDGEPPAWRVLLQALTAVAEADAALCAQLLGADTEVDLDDLERRALFLQPGSRPGWVRLTPLVREALQDGLDPAALQRLREVALDWFAAAGHGCEAIAVAVDLAQPERLLATLEAHGTGALHAGRADLVLQGSAALDSQRWSPRLQLLVGEALQMSGAWDDALVQLQRAADDDGALPAAHAWRAGLIHYLRGDLHEAVKVFQRAVRDGGAVADEALLAAWESAVHWRQGDVGGAAASAGHALQLATAAGDPQALAAAHISLAMVAAAQGDRRANDSHYLQALSWAERAGDALQTIRIRTNRSSFFLEEGAAEEAVAEATMAVRLADLTGYSSFHALALTNRSESLVMLGRLDEAHTDLRAAQAIEQRLRSLDVRYPVLQLGDLYRLRGDRSLARAAYQETLTLSEETDDLQSLVPALSGLARVLVDDEPARARELAERAVAIGSGIAHPAALLALARVELAGGDRAAATAHATSACEEAMTRRDRPAIAEALEIRALCVPDRTRALQLMEEAKGVWQELDNPIGLLRALLGSAWLMGGTEGELLAAHAEQELRARGAHGAVADVPAAPAGRRPIEVDCLGGFRVVRDGAVVPVTEWQSRKARDLLKILVARRGRAVPRETLMDCLWPDEPPERLGNRLSVALSTVRGILDPDKAHANDWFVRADQTAVSLDADHVMVDVEHFLTGAERGLELLRQGRGEEGLALLAAVEPRYRGDFLEEDLYEDWAADLREQARAVYVAVLRALADAAVAAGDPDGAVRRQLRLLERDPYDEAAHLDLVRTLETGGRHGEARRHYTIYTVRMRELDLEAASFPT